MNWALTPRFVVAVESSTPSDTAVRRRAHLRLVRSFYGNVADSLVDSRLPLLEVK